MRDQAAIIDTIYEAAVLPELWRTVIESIADYTGCFGGSLFSVSASGTMMMASRNCESHLQALMEEGWALRNIRAQRLVSFAKNGFVTDHDLCTETEIATHEIYTQFLRPRGLGWGIGTHIVGAYDDIAIFSLDQSYDRGPVSEEVRALLDDLRPHIARSAMLGAQFRNARIIGALNSLDTLGIPAATVNGDGKVVQENQCFSAFHPVSVGARDTLFVKDAAANVLLKKAIEQLRNHKAPKSLPVLSQTSNKPFVIHVIPVERQARDIFASVDAIVAIVPISFPGLPFKALVKSLYDLTHAETRVAEAMLAGLSVQEIASRFGVGVATIRTQVKSLLLKTGTSRQSELISKFSVFQSLPSFST